MTDFAPPSFRYPSTRYSGSKLRFLDWIWDHLNGLRFDSVLDVFGGTGSVSLMLKRYGKRVLYNDLLRFNQIIGTAVVQNSRVKVRQEDIDRVLKPSREEYPDFIQREFRHVFFLDEENAWLDRVITNISRNKDPYKRSILMASLFQACLAKRPFNLFHRANLYIRTSTVRRTFGNKTTWERSFSELLRRFVSEYNRAVFGNGRRNRVIGGYDALCAPNGVDLVYLDPPYFLADSSCGTNYLAFYHFLEGIADYENWAGNLNCAKAKLRRIADTKPIYNFTRKSQITESFIKLLERFQNSIIVLSYPSDGVPSKRKIRKTLEELGKRVKVFSRSHRYVLSSKTRKELLYIAE